MVLGQPVSWGTLRKLPPERRAYYVCEELGIDTDVLPSLRTGESSYRLEEAAKAIHRGDRKRLKLITSHVLRALTEYSSHVYSEGVGKYKRDRTYIKENYGLEVPLLELLRHKATGEKLPFLRERKYWEGFKPSNEDWLRDLKLPTPPFSRSMAQVIGVMLTDSVIVRAPKSADEIRLQGEKNDLPFYEYWLKPRVSKAFNMPLEVTVPVIQKGRETVGPFISIGSKAVKTWLVSDLGFSKSPTTKKKAGVKLPTRFCRGKDEKEGLLEGIWAGIGYMTYTPRGNPNSFMVVNKDKGFMEEVRTLSEELGYEPAGPTYRIGETTKGRGSWVLYYGVKDNRRMNFINPAHLPV